MDFKLHQLSGSNLTSIFKNAYIEAETIKDTEFCAINGERNMLLIAYSEYNILQFQNWVYFKKEFTEEDAHRFARAINEKMIMLKAYVSNTEEGEICIAIKYNHAILEHDSISGKTLVKLTRMVERHLLVTNQIYDEMFLKRS